MGKLIENAPELVSMYQLRYTEARVQEVETRKVIRIDNFRFGTRIPISPGQVNAGYVWQDVGLNTDLNVREGQKVVVGKTKVDGSEQALVLVVSAKAVD
jgi:hypothetical protein